MAFLPLLGPQLRMSPQPITARNADPGGLSPVTSTNTPAGGTGRPATPRPVTPLGKHGKRLWTSLTGPDPHRPGVPLYVFRADEIAVLEGAAHQLDRAASLLAEVAASGSSMVRGSQNEPVIDGRLVEARLCEVAARQALAQLRLPDAVPASRPRSSSGPVAWGAGDPAARQASAEADAAAQRRHERAAKGGAARWHKKPAEGG